MGIGEIIDRPRFSTLLDAYGVKVRLEADVAEIFELVKRIAVEAFVGRVTFSDDSEEKHDLHYSFLTDREGIVGYDLDGVRSGTFKITEGFSRYLNSSMRAHVAARANSWVFVHAGAVEWHGRALIIPGQSHQGKTTLVSELIRIGAGYLSDEFAILDSDGLVHPFDRDLAIRIKPGMGPVSVSPTDFGSNRVPGPLQAGMVLFTQFEVGANWQPERITTGQGILKAIPQVLPVSFNTEFSLKVLNTTFNRAIIVRSDRGEAKDVAPRILEYFDESIESGSAS